MVLARSSEAEQAPLESRVRGNKRVVIMPAYVCVCVCARVRGSCPLRGAGAELPIC